MTVQSIYAWMRFKAKSRDGYMTIDEIADALNTSVAKVCTMVARSGIQPIRFPGDMRKLYYNREDVQRIIEALGL